MTKFFALTLLILANLLALASVVIFALGFFPYKPFIPGLAQHDTDEPGGPVGRPFDKVIFMVVDALRRYNLSFRAWTKDLTDGWASDFVFGPSSGFAFTQSLIRSGSALPFTAHATSPTVTMPRLKALTTGGIPSFLDFILNFAESDTSSTLAHQDTWLAQIKARGDQLIMFGDDTWLKLFPNTFARADGTTSFFVSDFTEVDTNVTRHVPKELAETDWSAMIVHYLGLDHIGHKAGHLSSNMVPKQREMDGIVELIYEAMKGQKHLEDTLLVLCGDHGMTDAGNHGGSSPGETSPALVFISDKLQTLSTGLNSPENAREDFRFYTKVEQSDIVPTLAGLLDLPISLNNLGVFIKDLLPLWNDQDKIRILFRNAKQLKNIVKATFPHQYHQDKRTVLDCDDPGTTAEILACKSRTIDHVLQQHTSVDPLASQIIPALLDFCRSAQESLSSTASNYNIEYLFLGISLTLGALTLALIATGSRTSILTFHNLFPVALLLVYGVLMFASSYVEEEHQFWYWCTSGWLAYLFIRSGQRSKPDLSSADFLWSIFLLQPLHRLIRSWNQTGQKFAGFPDLVTAFLSHHTMILWSLIGMTYLFLSMRLGHDLSKHIPKHSHLITRSIAAGVAMPAFIFKLAFAARDTPEVIQGLIGPAGLKVFADLDITLVARTVFLGCALAIVIIFGAGNVATREKYPGASDKVGMLKSLLTVVTIFLVTQTRTHNIPLFALFHIQLESLLTLHSWATKQYLTTVETTMTILTLAHTSFFALGNSNGISSVDLSNGYNGVGDYQAGIVGVLIFVSNWAGPTWWAWAGLLLLASSHEPARAQLRTEASSAGSAGGLKAPLHVNNKRDQSRLWVQDERDRLRALATPSSPHLHAFPRIPMPMAQQPQSADSPILAYLAVQTVFFSFMLLSVMTACMALRAHLFVWTVFSPKYLFAMSWLVGWHVIVCCMLLPLFWALVTLICN